MKAKEAIECTIAVIATAGIGYLAYKHRKGLGKVISEAAKNRPRKPVVVKTKHYRDVLDVIFDTPEIRTTVYYR